MINLEIRQPTKNNPIALGAGFLLESEVAITAAHCVSSVTRQFPEDPEGIKKGNAKIHIETPAGDEITINADVVSDENMDIAIITFPKKTFGLEKLIVRRSQNVPIGASWVVQSVFDHMPTLEGTVADPHKRYTFQSSKTISTIQLTCKAHLATHEGYSGSALQLKNGRDPWPVAGMVIEQYLDPERGNKPTNILFALSIETITKSEVYNQVTLEGVGVHPSKEAALDSLDESLERALKIEDARQQLLRKKIALLEEFPFLPQEFTVPYLSKDLDLGTEDAFK